MAYQENYVRAVTGRYMENELKCIAPIGPVVVHADAVGVGKKARWRCRIAGLAAGDVVVADVKGAERLFTDVGRLLVQVARDLQIVGGEYSLQVHAGTVFDKALPVDLVTSLKAEGWKTYPVGVALGTLAANIEDQLIAAAGWSAGTPQQVARWGELNERAAAVANERSTVLSRVDVIVAQLASMGLVFDPATPPAPAVPKVV